jgi:WXXGXW repeat (2 copies)
MTNALLAGISAALVLGAVTGCVVETAVNAPASGVAVSGPPPEPMREMRQPPPPGGSAMWIAGYWHWTGMQYTWIPGHWVVPPAGTQWRAPHYSLHDGTYFYEQGGWTGR